MRSARLIVIALFLVGCGGAAPTPQLIYVTPPPSSASSPETATVGPTQAESELPAITPGRTMRPLPTPRQSTPNPNTPSVQQGDPILLTWQDDGYTTAQIMLPVENVGEGWVQLLEFDSQWTAYDSSGTIVETGSFDAAAPKNMLPTGESYLVAEWFGDEHSADDFSRVEADSYYRDSEDPGTLLVPENVTTRRHDFGGVEVVGEASNMGSTAVENADVVALFFNSSGEELGYARGFVENVPAGGTRSFQIDSSFAEIKIAQIAETRVFISAWDF